jgi:teichuronic acid biosynthesis glycosyltransferase TuaC
MLRSGDTGAGTTPSVGGRKELVSVPDNAATPSILVISHLYPQRARGHLGVFVSEQVRALVGIGASISGVVVPVPLVPWPLPLLSIRWRQFADAECARTDFASVAVDFPRYLAFPRRFLPAVSAASLCRAVLRDAALAERVRSADVIVAHTALLDGEAARRLSRALSTPYVVFVHGADLRENLREDAPDAVRATVAAVLREAAAVVAVSEAVARGIRSRVTGLRDVRVLHNGVDPTLFSPEPRDSDDGRGTAPTLRTLSAGRLVDTKANDLVVRAIAMLSARGLSVEHTIAGDGPEMGRLRRLATELGIADRVRFTGAYPHGDLPALMRGSDLFVLPSWDEAFGIVYLEAMASGVPVIAASDGGATDIVTEGADGWLVGPRDVEAIVDAIAGFAAMGPADREQMSSAARRKAEAFTWEANARGLMRMAADVIAARRAG